MRVPPFHLLEQSRQNQHRRLLALRAPSLFCNLSLTVGDVGDGAVVPGMDIEPVRDEVLSHDPARRDDPV